MLFLLCGYVLCVMYMLYVLYVVILCRSESLSNHEKRIIDNLNFKL